MLAVAGLAVWFWPWGVLLLWPAISLGIVASAYFGVGPSRFSENRWTIALERPVGFGSLPVGPVALVALLSAAMPAVGQGHTGSLDWARAQRPRGSRSQASRRDRRARSHRGIFRDEAIPHPRLSQYSHPRSHSAIDRAIARDGDIHRRKVPPRVVYIHCKIGYSRTAGAAAAYLLQTGKAGGVSEALEMLRGVRPSIVVRPEVQSALSEFADALTSSVIPSGAKLVEHNAVNKVGAIELLKLAERLAGTSAAFR